MVSAFDTEKLYSLLADFYRITDIRITVFDSDGNELISYPEVCPPFCQLIRSTEQGRRACAECDKTACAVAATQHSTYIYTCHAGLTEAIMPLWVGNALVGFLLFGHIFSYDTPEQGLEHIKGLCADYPLEPSLLRDSLTSCSQANREYIHSAAHILHATASYLVLERMATLKGDSPSERLDSYLDRNFTEPLTVAAVCKELKLGRSQLYKLSSKLYGCGVAEHIRELRLNKAKQLLGELPHMKITEIASACGFSDYNYFISVFSKCVGCSPNAYRKRSV